MADRSVVYRLKADAIEFQTASYSEAKGEAETVYSLLVEQNDSDVESLYNLGWALYSLNRRNAATDAWVSSCGER